MVRLVHGTMGPIRSRGFWTCMQPVRQPLSFPAGLIPCVWSALFLLFAALFPFRLGRSQADSPGFFAIGPLCIMLLGPRCGLLSLGAQADPVGSRDMVFLRLDRFIVVL